MARIEQNHRPTRLLFVDDETATIDMYKRIFRPQDQGAMSRLAEQVYETSGRSARQPRYDITTCTQGDEALKAVKEAVASDNPYSVAFIDVRMPPGPDGVWTAEQIRAADPHIELVIMTGFSDITVTEIEGRIPPPHKLLYMQKPFHVPELVHLAGALSAKWDTERIAYRLYKTLDEQVLERTRDLEATNAALEKTLGDLRKTFSGIVSALTGMVEIRDPYTASHQVRVSDLARAMAVEMGLPPERIEGIRVAGIVHDIGKIAIPTEILSKPGRLNENERALIKGHSKVGFELLSPIEFPWTIAEIVHQHHERLDGSGYPLGLKGNAIAADARILIVADVVEAMASHRPYRPSLGVDKALQEIETHRGTLYDAGAVDACLILFKKKSYTLK